MRDSSLDVCVRVSLGVFSYVGGPKFDGNSEKFPLLAKSLERICVGNGVYNGISFSYRH